MSYVKHILLDGEHILYDGRVHPRVLVPGTLLLGLAAWILHISSHTGGGRSFLMRFVYWLSGYWKGAGGLYKTLYNWQVQNPNIAVEIKVLALLIALAGLASFMKNLALIQTTELIVTDQRIIAKTGITTITTVELDRRRVSGVVVNQSMLGRMMGYGNVYIQGFTTAIGGLPALVNPHLIEKYVL